MALLKLSCLLALCGLAMVSADCPAHFVLFESQCCNNFGVLLRGDCCTDVVPTACLCEPTVTDSGCVRIGTTAAPTTAAPTTAAPTTAAPTTAAPTTAAPTTAAPTTVAPTTAAPTTAAPTTAAPTTAAPTTAAPTTAAPTTAAPTTAAPTTAAPTTAAPTTAAPTTAAPTTAAPTTAAPTTAAPTTAAPTTAAPTTAAPTTVAPTTATPPFCPDPVSISARLHGPVSQYTEMCEFRGVVGLGIWVSQDSMQVICNGAFVYDPELAVGGNGRVIRTTSYCWSLLEYEISIGSFLMARAFNQTFGLGTSFPDFDVTEFNGIATLHVFTLADFFIERILECPNYGCTYNLLEMGWAIDWTSCNIISYNGTDENPHYAGSDLIEPVALFDLSQCESNNVQTIPEDPMPDYGRMCFQATSATACLEQDAGAPIVCDIPVTSEQVVVGFTPTMSDCTSEYFYAISYNI